MNQIEKCLEHLVAMFSIMQEIKWRQKVVLLGQTHYIQIWNLFQAIVHDKMPGTCAQSSPEAHGLGQYFPNAL